MTTNTVTGDQVWQALSRDASFQAGIPSQAHGVVRELAEALPTVLADQLDTPATLRNLMAAKLAVLRHIARTGYLPRLMRAYPRAAFGPLDPEEMIKGIPAMIEGLIAEIEPLIGPAVDLAELLGGATEEQILASPKHGMLNAEAMAAYRAGTLTVGTLLTVQPNALINNT